MNYNDNLLKITRNKYPRGMRVRLVSMHGEPRMHPGLEGTVEFVDDALNIHVSWDNGSTLSLIEDVDRFNVLSDSKIRVVLVEPGTIARVVFVEGTVESAKAVVGGDAEMLQPSELPKDVVIIRKREYEPTDQLLNRSVRNGQGLISEPIFGTFFVCNKSEEGAGFASLTSDQAESYLKRFEHPEIFIKLGSSYVSFPLKD